MNNLAKKVVSFLEENGVSVNKETSYFRNGCSFENAFRAIKESKQYNNGVIIWGASKGGLMTLRKLQKYGVPVKFFVDIDKNKQGTKLKEIPILSPDIIKKDDFVVIGTMHVKEVVNSLKELDVGDYASALHYSIFDIDGTSFLIEFDKFLNVLEFLSDETSRKNYMNLLAYSVDNDIKHIHDSISDYQQYFHPHVSPEDDDVIVDGGAYTGDTINEIMKSIGNRCKIYAFEPDRKIFSKLENKHKDFANIVLENYGLWHKNTVVEFKGQGDMCSHITEAIEGSVKTQAYYIYQYHLS